MLRFDRKQQNSMKKLSFLKQYRTNKKIQSFLNTEEKDTLFDGEDYNIN